MPLIKNGQRVDDPWRNVTDDGEVPSDGSVIVTLARWRNERDRLAQRKDPIGIRLPSDVSIADLAGDVRLFSLIALEFPTFRDGRAYSSARLLRQRYGFKGELRAVGDVLRDQFMFMHRCGFDAFEIAKEGDVEGWRQAMAEVSVWYQPAADDRVPVALQRRMRSAAE